MTFISIFCVCVFFKPMLKTNSCIFRCLTGWGKNPSNRWVQLSLYLKLFWLCELVVAALTAWTQKIQASIQQTVVYSQSGVNIPKHLSPGASGAKHGCTVPSHILHARSHTHTHTQTMLFIVVMCIQVAQWLLWMDQQLPFVWIIGTRLFQPPGSDWGDLSLSLAHAVVFWGNTITPR